jgi:hypothetical protein
MCSICFENFNKIHHLKVTCPFCDLDACKTCVQTYLLSSTQDAHCMKCKHEFNREFIDTFCTKAFRNKDYKTHRENILFERENARMPETQPHVTRELEIRHLRISYIYLIYLVSCMRTLTDFTPRIRICLNELLQSTAMTVLETIHAVRYNEPIATTTLVLAEKCPSAECRGFLTYDHVCGICKETFCEKCREVNHDGHACNPDTVKTIKLLKRDTKPCPKCNVPIHKIEGCAQMWCTQCYTAFDWRTGHVETGRIHNPHYFEFKKRTREHGDIPCGGRPNYRELKVAGASKEMLDISIELFRMERELMYRYGYIFDDNLRLRMKYMLKELTCDAFKKELQKRDKYNSKMRDIQDIYRMFLDTVGDILRQYMLDMSMEDTHMKEIVELSHYTNNIYDKIRKRYNCMIPHNIILDMSR